MCDHKLIQLRLHVHEPIQCGPPRFKYELQGLSASLTCWNKDSFGSVRREIKEMKCKLELLQNKPARDGPLHEELKIVEKLLELYYMEEIRWRQRSRIEWLATGNKKLNIFTNEHV